MTAEITPDATAPNTTIVLIHGLWMTPRSWEKWTQRYEGKGYRVLAPAWPGMEVEVEALNADPSPIAALDIYQLVEHYERIINELDSPPIIMGHSLGGTLLQILLDRGLGAAGVGVAPATVKGVLDLPLSTLRAILPVLRNPFKRHSAVPLNPRQFHYAQTNTLSEEESEKVYERYHVPGALTVLREVAFQNLHRDAPTKVDFANDARAPMLFIAFEDDHLVPPSAIRHNAEKYEGSQAITEFREFPDRPHFLGVPGYEEVADYALDWAVENAKRSAAWV